MMFTINVKLNYIEMKGTLESANPQRSQLQIFTTTVTCTQHLCYWLASCTTQSNNPVSNLVKVNNQHSSFNFIVVELAVSLYNCMLLLN